MSKDTFKKLMTWRFATKQFKPNKTISNVDMEYIIEMGRLTPSSMGLEPWKVLEITNPEIKQRMFPVCWGAQRGQLEAPRFLVLLAAQGPMYAQDQPYVVNMMRNVHHYPEELIPVYGTKISHMFDDLPPQSRNLAYFNFSCHQVHMMAQTMNLAAAEIGIDTCMIGGFDADALNQLLSRSFNLYDNKYWGACLCMAFGHREKTPEKPKTRKDIQEIYLTDSHTIKN